MPEALHIAPELRARIESSLANIQERMAAATQRAGRAENSVRMIAVTKYVGLPEVLALRGLGVSHFGENRPERVGEKTEAVRDVTWHMIGNVQRRKVKTVLEHFQRVDAIDRLKLAEALQRRCEELDLTCAGLIEVNVSGEEAKHGVAPERVGEMLEHLDQLDRVTVDGLMTMAPHGAEEKVLRKVFARLRELAAQYALPEVSMGMTSDFEIAIEEGATEVRIGRALFAE